MEKLKRFYNQNRKSIYKLLCIIVLFLVFINLLNFYYKEKNSADIEKIKKELENNNVNILNSVNVKSEESANASEIDSFLEYCKNSDYENAYNMLSDETKEKAEYSTKDKFIENFINNGKQYLATKLSFVSDVYMIEIYKENIMETGNMDSAIRKYATNQNNKIGLSDYIEKKNIKRSVMQGNTEIVVNTATYYYDYVEYDMSISNNSNRSINVSEVYLNIKDEKTEMQNIGEINNNSSQNIQLKFNVEYKNRSNIRKINLKIDQEEVTIEV